MPSNARNALTPHLSRRSLAALGLTAVIGLSASACAMPGNLGAADASDGAAKPSPTTTAAPAPTTVKPTTTTTTAAPTTTTTSTAPPAPSKPVGSRNAALWPFSSDSPWNTPIGSGAALESTSGPLTSMIRARSLGSSNLTTWINSDQYSHPVYVATASDPVATITQPWDAAVTARVPAGAVPANGGDRHLHVVQPDGRTIIEMWTATRESSTKLNAGRVEVVDLYGNGLGPDNGVRAYGGSAVGGLIRKWEVDRSDPNYTDGVIRHAIAIAVPSGMLRYGGGGSGYDAAGFGTAKGYVWPATEQDYDSPSSYSGTIPMGQLFTIPKSVNVDSLGLSPSARAIAKAIQDYGAYITDRTGPTTVALYAEVGVPSAWLGEAVGPSWSGSQLTAIRSNLVAVTNNGPSSVGGGGSRPLTVAPALR